MAGKNLEERVHRYTLEDRAEQLSAFADAAELFGQHGPPDLAAVYASLAVGARRALTDGFQPPDLHELATSIPGRLAWLNPKCAEYQCSRELWQDHAAERVDEVERWALDLRATATFGS